MSPSLLPQIFKLISSRIATLIWYAPVVLSTSHLRRASSDKEASIRNSARNIDCRWTENSEIFRANASLHVGREEEGGNTQSWRSVRISRVQPLCLCKASRCLLLYDEFRFKNNESYSILLDKKNYCDKYFSNFSFLYKEWYDMRSKPLATCGKVWSLCRSNTALARLTFLSQLASDIRAKQTMLQIWKKILSDNEPFDKSIISSLNESNWFRSNHVSLFW